MKLNNIFPLIRASDLEKMKKLDYQYKKGDLPAPQHGAGPVEAACAKVCDRENEDDACHVLKKGRVLF